MSTRRIKTSRSKRKSKPKRSKSKTSRNNIRLYTLYKSSVPEKKFDVYVENKKTGGVKKVSFGATGYEDYTIHRDKERRERYRSRHKKDNIKNPMYPGFWSWHILWGESTSIAKNMSTIQKYIRR